MVQVGLSTLLQLVDSFVVDYLELDFFLFIFVFEF